MSATIKRRIQALLRRRLDGRWNSGKDEQGGNLSYKVRHKGYFPVSPADALQDIRSEMLTMQSAVLRLSTWQPGSV